MITQPTQSTRYVSQTDTVKMLRAALKAAFPGIKFSVRQHRSSVRIAWHDGPSENAVNAVARHYEGEHYDSAYDLASPIIREENGERVHYGLRFVFTNRSYSVAFLTSCAEAVVAHWGVPMPTIYGREERGARAASMGYHLDGVLHRYCMETDARPATPVPSERTSTKPIA